MDEKLVNRFWSDASAIGAVVWAANASYVRPRKSGESLPWCAGVALAWTAPVYVLDVLATKAGQPRA